jgi:glycosyltransferase involved in cell wall biosynthesis
MNFRSINSDEGIYLQKNPTSNGEAQRRPAVSPIPHIRSTHKTRIGYVIGQLKYGGAERQLYELVRMINPGQFKCFVYCLSERSEPFGRMIRESGVELRILRRRRHLDLGRARELASWLRQDRVEILHSFLFKANGYAWLAARLAGVPRLVTSARNCKEIGFVRDWVNSVAFRASDAIVCNGGAVQSFAAQHFKMPLQKSVVIYNGVDLDRFLAHQVHPSCARLNLKPEHRVVITVGRLVLQKDVELFIEAAKLLEHDDPNVRFLVVGDGPRRLDLMRYASQNGLDGKLSFLGERDDVPQLLARADVFWLTSQWEGLPNVVLEAMACGKPVLARDVGACHELINHGETGFLISSRDAKQFADHTRELLRDPGRARAMGLAGRRLVEERFSVARMCQATETLYHSLLESRL